MQTSYEPTADAIIDSILFGDITSSTDEEISSVESSETSQAVSPAPSSELASLSDVEDYFYDSDHY